MPFNKKKKRKGGDPDFRPGKSRKSGWYKPELDDRSVKNDKQELYKMLLG